MQHSKSDVVDNLLKYKIDFIQKKEKKKNHNFKKEAYLMNFNL